MGVGGERGRSVGIRVRDDEVGGRRSKRELRIKQNKTKWNEKINKQKTNQESAVYNNQ